MTENNQISIQDASRDQLMAAVAQMQAILQAVAAQPGGQQMLKCAELEVALQMKDAQAQAAQTAQEAMQVRIAELEQKLKEATPAAEPSAEPAVA